MPISDRVLDHLAEVAETDEVRENLDLRLYDQHILDSLATVDLILALSEEFGIDIPPASLDRQDWATPRLIIADVERRLGARRIAA
ncbi:MAG TPA: D-alanine--poly(phosphoribitol) ligase subunit DltC [Chloroflexota bacterium]